MGKGREFEKLREYVRGDSLNDIHWKATAKRGHPVTKEYQIERTQEVYIAIDASRMSGRAGKYLSGHGGAGETALASMLQSCSPGLAVVNIGNGLGAGAFACLIAKRCSREK